MDAEIMDISMAPLSARLPRLSLAEARARNRLLASLDGERVGEATLSARIVEAGAAMSSGMGVCFSTGAAELWLRAETVDGQPAQRLEAARSAVLPEALVELSRLEPLIAALERACGQPLEPRGIADAEGGGLRLRLAMIDAAGLTLHAVHLMIPKTLAAEWPDRPAVRGLGLAAYACTPCRLTLQGPLAPRGELALLEAGDVVIAPTRAGGGWPARLEAGPILHRGVYDLVAARFQVHREDIDMPDALNPADPGVVEATRMGDLPVRLQVVLPAIEMSVGALAGMAPGTVASLPVEGDDLPVELVAEGVRVASGRLVALGSTYGVLIDQVAGR